MTQIILVKLLHFFFFLHLVRCSKQLLLSGPFKKKRLFNYLAVSGLSCGMQDLHCIRRGPLWWCTDFLAAACRLSGSVAGGILVPRPGIKPESSAVQGEFLTAGPPGKSLSGPLKMPTLLGCLESTHWSLLCCRFWIFPYPTYPLSRLPAKSFLCIYCVPGTHRPVGLA